MEENMKTKNYYEMANGIKCEKERKRTAGQTMWAVRCFQNWCFEHLGQTIDFSASSKTELNEVLCKFYSTVKNGRGEPYGSSGFNGLRAGLNRHLSEPPLLWSLMKDSEFMPSNYVFLAIAKKLQSESDRSSHQQEKADGDFVEVARLAVLDRSTPEEPVDVHSNPASLASLKPDPMDSDSGGGNAASAQATLRQVVESWGRPEAPVTLKTESDEGNSNPSSDEINTQDPPSWPTSDDDRVPYLTEMQMMARVRQQRFTQDELDILVREIQARYHRIYTKGLPFAIIRRAWEEVAAAVTAAGVGPVRTASACQTRFRDLKRRSRMKLTNGVGRGPLQRPKRGYAGENVQSASKTAVRPTAVSPEMGVAGVVDGGSSGASPDPSPPSSTVGAPSSSSDVSGQAPSSPADLPSQTQEDLAIQDRNPEVARRGWKPRSRKHFTGEQMDVLLREIKARHHRLYGESQNPLRCEDRRQAWEEVAAAINLARCGPTKTAAACSKRFSDLKRRRETRLGTRMMSIRQDWPVITATFSHASPMGIHILPSVTMEPHTQSAENTVTAAFKPKQAATQTQTHVTGLAPGPVVTPTLTLPVPSTQTPAPAPTPRPPEGPGVPLEDGVPGFSPLVSSSPAGGGVCVCAYECVCARRRRREQELLEVQRGGLEVLRAELGALRRGMNTRLRRMESRTYPLLLSVSRSLERIANAMERSSATGAFLGTDTPPRTPRGGAVAEQPAISQSCTSSNVQSCKTERRT